MMVFVHIWDGEVGISTFLFVSFLLLFFLFLCNTILVAVRRDIVKAKEISKQTFMQEIPSHEKRLLRSF